MNRHSIPRSSINLNSQASFPPQIPIAFEGYSATGHWHSLPAGKVPAEPDYCRCPGCFAWRRSFAPVAVFFRLDWPPGVCARYQVCIGCATKLQRGGKVALKVLANVESWGIESRATREKKAVRA